MDSLKIGSLLQSGRYRIDGVLGQGGFGITYLATDLHRNAAVAVKEFFFKEYCERDGANGAVTVPSVGKKEFVEKFKRKFIKEARILSGLSHRNIVHVFDSFTENETAYYVMEHVAGRTLSALIKERGKLDCGYALTIINPLCAALSYLHAKKINHLDVKPGNVMIEHGTGRVVLIDFGVSKLYDAETGDSTTTTPVGLSHGYSPLEQYNAQSVKRFAPQTDIYALGATLYKMVTGITPPSAVDVSQTGLPPMPPSTSLPVRTAIAKSMMSRREDRPASIAVFMAILNGAITQDEATTFSTPPSFNPDDATELDTKLREEKPKKKSKALLWVSLILLLLLIGGGVYWYLYEQEVNRQRDAEIAAARAAYADVEEEEEAEVADLVLDHYSKTSNGDIGNSIISVEYPTGGNANLVQNVREWINESLGGKYSGDLSDGRALVDFYVSNFDPEMLEYGYEKVIIKKSYENSKVVTFTYSYEGYYGGVHGSEAEYGVTFRKSDGKKFSLDMIADRSALQSTMKSGLKKYFNVTSDSELDDRLMIDPDVYDISHLPYPSVEPWIAEDGIVFYYREYEIAGYADGSPSFTIPNNQIEDNLNATGKTFFE